MKVVERLNFSHIGNVLFRKLPSGYILTNISGDWLHLNDNDFKRLLDNAVSRDEPLYRELSQRQFLKAQPGELPAQASKYLSLHRSVYTQGTTLFIIVLTLRCNHRCVYCQSSSVGHAEAGFDMDEATAKKTMDLIFRCPSQNIRIEFQGGEPVLNWPVLEYIVKYAKELAKITRKNLKIDLVSNLTLLDDQKMEFLLDHDVAVSCSLDGPAEVHDQNRPFSGRGGSHAKVVKKIAAMKKKIEARRADFRGKSVEDLNAITTVSKYSLPFSREIIDEYLRLKFNNIFLRPLSPFGLSPDVRHQIGCGAEEFIRFYRKSLDYIIDLNLKGTLMIERNAYFALLKILKNTDPAYYELRNPCGAGIGQMAFNYDGSIYTCDEGRMAARMGIDHFKLGDVQDSRFEDLIDHEVTKTMCLASCLDNHAGCVDCAYKPFCGICPLLHYVEYGTIFPKIQATDYCKVKMAMFDYLFLKLRSPKYQKVFENWFTQAVSSP